jgi:hypothetical protein
MPVGETGCANGGAASRGQLRNQEHVNLGDNPRRQVGGIDSEPSLFSGARLMGEEHLVGAIGRILQAWPCKHLIFMNN